MQTISEAQGSAISDSIGQPTSIVTEQAVTDYKIHLSTPEIGQLILLPASYIKPNQPLVNIETGCLEIVDSEKYFSSETHSRYYVITDETPTSQNLVFALNNETKQGQVTMYSEYVHDEAEIFFTCYPAANSIIERLHVMYYDKVQEGGIEYIRFTKIHSNKYAGFPRGNSNRIPPTEAKERWDYIFQHILITNPTNLRKKRIGVLFGTIAGADLRLRSTVDLLIKYKDWIIS